MKRFLTGCICVIMIAVLLGGYTILRSDSNVKNSVSAADAASDESSEAFSAGVNVENVNEKTEQKNDNMIPGTETQKGFVNDNVLRSDLGDIHFSSYIPDSYDGSEPYALFVTLPGWEGLYFQGVGANMFEDFGPEAIKYNDKMIILSTQLDDWGETSADMAIELTEYFLENYNIDPDKVYLHGMSGGGETGSLVMGKRPKLYTAYLMTSSQWDGDLEVLADAGTPVYLVIGEDDSYYGFGSMKNAYAELHELYEKQGLEEDEIDRLLVLDVKDAQFFADRGFKDQHMGAASFAYEEDIMGWLFGEH